MLEQRKEYFRSRIRSSRQQSELNPLFGGSTEGDEFSVVAYQSNGAEHLVKIHGTITPGKHATRVEVRMGFTGTWLMSLVAGAVIAFAVAYLYTFLGYRIFRMPVDNNILPYLLLEILSVYVNVRRYNTKAVALVEQLIYWLELEED